MKYSVIGCGRWGSFIAWYQATVLKNNVTLYGEEGRAAYDVLKNTGRNEYVALDERIARIPREERIVLRIDKNSRFDHFIQVIDLFKKHRHENFAIATEKEAS